MMQFDEKDPSNQNQTRKKSKICIYFILITLTIGVVLLFIMEFYDSLKSECYIDESRYRILRSDNEQKKDLKGINEDVLTVSHAFESTPPTTTEPIFPSIHEERYLQPNQTKNENNVFRSDIVRRQVKRQQKLRMFCRGEAHEMKGKKGRAQNLLYSEKQGVIYCSVPKVACTNWKRMMLVFDGKINDPLEVAKKENVHTWKYSHLNKLPNVEREWRKNLYYSFMFVRHPFERLLSAYRNKLLDPYSAAFQKRYGAKILNLFRANLTQKQYQEGKNVTFKEFVDFLIYVYENKGAKHFDEHWQVMHTLCRPCSMKYNYIGKMETLVEDANQVLKELGLHNNVKFPANATDKYHVEVKTLMKKYYSPLSKESLEKLYEIYEDDFRAFGYEIPDYLQTNDIT